MTASNEMAARAGEPAAESVLPNGRPDLSAPVDRVTDGDERPSGDRLIDRFIHNLLAALAPWNT
jgi:hypothetical protein